jgi:hypothetical protein
MRILESTFLVFALVGEAMGAPSSMASVKEASRGLSFKLKRTIVDRSHPKNAAGKRPRFETTNGKLTGREVSGKTSAHSRHVAREGDHLENRQANNQTDHKAVFWDYFDESKRHLSLTDTQCTV